MVTETSLTITRVTKDHSGVYQCVAKSKLGQVTEAAHLQVKSPSEIDFIWPELPPVMATGPIDSTGKALSSEAFQIFPMFFDT